MSLAYFSDKVLTLFFCLVVFYLQEFYPRWFYCAVPYKFLFGYFSFTCAFQLYFSLSLPQSVSQTSLPLLSVYKALSTLKPDQILTTILS